MDCEEVVVQDGAAAYASPAAPVAAVHARAAEPPSTGPMECTGAVVQDGLVAPLASPAAASALARPAVAVLGCPMDCVGAVVPDQCVVSSSAHAAPAQSVHGAGDVCAGRSYASVLAGSATPGPTPARGAAVQTRLHVGDSPFPRALSPTLVPSRALRDAIKSAQNHPSTTTTVLAQPLPPDDGPVPSGVRTQ